MRVHLFDPGLRHATGHHADWALRISASLARRGAAVAVWGARGLDPELARAIAAGGVACAPLFSRFAYDEPVPDAEPAMLDALSRQMAREIADAGPADLALFPSLDLLQLAALPFTAPAPVAALVHQPPPADAALVGALWDTALSRLRCWNRPPTLAAIDPLVADALRERSPDWPWPAWPQPIDGVVRPAPTTPRTVGFFGNQRAERGLALIPPLTDGLLQAGWQVLIHDSMRQFQPRQGVPGLKLVQGFVTDLAAVVGECDLIVCPMDVERYRLRSSGIACLALACGRPVLLPQGTSMASQMAGSDAAATYREATPQALLEAIARMAGRYPRHAEAARAAAVDWSSWNGVERFVDTVLAVAGSPAGQGQGAS